MPSPTLQKLEIATMRPGEARRTTNLLCRVFNKPAAALRQEGYGQGNATIIVARTGEKIIGAVQYTPDPGNGGDKHRFFYGSYLCVDPKWREQGVAWGLAEAFENKARAELGGKQGVILIPGGAIPPTGLYEKRGFVPLSQLCDSLGQNALPGAEHRNLTGGYRYLAKLLNDKP